MAPNERKVLRMRKLVLTGMIVTALTLTMALQAIAANEKTEKTITGEGKCAKCALKEAKSCESVVQVKEDGKTVTYYLAQNDVSKAFHKNICQDSKKITATGTVKKVHGRLELVPTKIELVKE